MRAINLKPQDILLVVHLLSDTKFRKQTEYATELGMSQAEISASLKRLAYVNLIDKELLLPYRANVEEFLVHAIKYIFPIEYEKVQKGIPTGSSFSPLNKVLRSNGLPIVWASDEGTEIGNAVKPLFPSVPHIIGDQHVLHQRLALIDSIRMAKPRERALAVNLFKEIQ